MKACRVSAEKKLMIKKFVNTVIIERNLIVNFMKDPRVRKEGIKEFYLFHSFLRTCTYKSVYLRYLFKCKGRDERGGKLIFQLEICSVPDLQTIVGKYSLI